MTEGLPDDEQRAFRAWRKCVDMIFTLKKIWEKIRDKKCRVCVGFIDLEKAYGRVKSERLW